MIFARKKENHPHDITGSAIKVVMSHQWRLISVNGFSSSCLKRCYPAMDTSGKSYDSLDLLYRKSIGPYEPQSDTSRAFPLSCLDLYL